MIELQQVNKVYQTKAGTLTALTDIDLSVKAGEIYGVIGKSGAGKSTLIRCVNLLERPSSGSVKVAGQELTILEEKALRQVRHGIGMIFQHFNLLTTRTVYQNIAFPLELIGTKKKAIEKIVFPLLELTGLTERAHAYPSQLSGGQKQRVAIARALATKPKVLLCDEMTSSLDPETTASILQLIKDINQQMNLSILLITHEMDVIKAIADRVAVIDEGRIIEQSDVVSIFRDPQSQIAKTFIRSVIQPELPEFIKQKIQSTAIADGCTLLRIAFIGKSTTEPVIDYLVKHYSIRVNILQANIEFLRSETIGMMVVSISGADAEIAKAKQYLIDNNLEIEVVGYVATDNWSDH